MSKPIIILDGISFRYDELTVLEDICLSIRDKDFLGIVGPNGSGKSTLLKLILGLLRPQQGTIEIFGTSPAQARLKIGYVPQFATFDRNFPITVLNTVLQGRLGKTRTLFGYTRQDREAARQSLAEVEILDLEQRPLTALSGGQLQRVLIARALTCSPEVLILDEPTAHIDPKVEEGVFELLKRLNERLTVIVVSHDVGFITRYITRVACLNRRLVCHPATELTGKMIEELYGGPLKVVQHDTLIHGHD
ncbi:MAG: ABC transporter ATP-binding protein [Desulfuromonadaceae bacterium]|nr:ABC transporter ATP-binding protein [Desulfuromonadaceae bacterium]